jgi:hypothetical protein
MLSLQKKRKNNFLLKGFLLLLLLLIDVRSQSSIGEISLPDSSYHRVTVDPSSFGAWLRSQKLMPPNSPVLDYSHREYKPGSDTTVAFVMDIDIHNRRTEQCMDILVRLYSEYCWQRGHLQELKFPLPGGYFLTWQDWMNGLRPKFKSYHVSMYKTQPQDSSYKNFESYLRTVYAESHTQQFFHAYVTIDRRKLQVGDFIVLKGSKAHAVMIVDLVKDDQGKKKMLVGHGDTPACQFYLLSYKKNQPWFPVDFDKEILPLPIRRKMKWSGLRRFNLIKNAN